ncbi:MAG: hypothetical protein RLZZ347_29 [Candidatus Parcubacteria bacterium]
MTTPLAVVVSITRTVTQLLVALQSERVVMNHNAPKAPVEEPDDEHVELSGNRLRSSDELRRYFRDISAFPLLTREEEIELGKRKDKGDKQACDTLVCSNLLLVASIAYDHEGLGVPVPDLINEGNIGLCKAVEKFDWRYDAKLSTYARWWIRQKILEALSEQGRTIRIPTHRLETFLRYRKYIKQLETSLGRSITEEELAEETGESVEKIRNLFAIAQKPIELDAPLGTDGDTATWMDTLEDEYAENPRKVCERRENIKLAKRLLQTLTPRERTLIGIRFGLDGDSDKTLEEVGEQFGITAERIRQIQNKALRKMAIALEKINRIN